MPETAMDENYSFVFREHNIRMPRISFIIFAITQATAEEILSDDFFGFCIFCPNPGHIVASLLFSVIIRQIISSPQGSIVFAFKRKIQF